MSPKDGATGRSVSTTVTATFSEKMKPDTLTSTTFMLAKGTKDTKPPTPTPTTAIPATVTLSPDGLMATRKSSTNLAKCTWYKAVVKGGSGGAADEAGNTLAADKVWSFKTAC